MEQIDRTAQEHDDNGEEDAYLDQDRSGIVVENRIRLHR
jgi:hypothetical protein